MSFYSTVASSTWKNPYDGKPNAVDIHGDTSTGFIKNFPHCERTDGEAEGREQFMSTYRSVNDIHSRRSSEGNTVVGEPNLQGGFASSNTASPIKWNRDLLRRNSPLPSKRILSVRRKRDPTEWENEGMGPDYYSTSFRTSYPAPGEQEDKCNARAPERTDVNAFDKAGLPSGWRENNHQREHPWYHSEDKMSTTYTDTLRPVRSSYGKRAESPMSSSGYARAQSKVVFGRSQLQPLERMSTTHLSYIKGRTNSLAGQVVEIAPMLEGNRLGESGFCKNLPQPGSIIPQSSTSSRKSFSTSFQSAFVHPATHSSGEPTSMNAAAGLPSSYARAITPVTRLESVTALPLNQLHPTVALLRAKRDPFFYDAKTFKITQGVQPWGLPQSPIYQ